MQRQLGMDRLALAHAEKSKIAAEIKDVELVFIRPVQQTGTKTGTPANHLPEFGLAHDLFEKYQIQHLWHIDSSVQHIHGNGNLRQLAGIGKVVNSALGIGHVVVDDLGESIAQMGIFPLKHLQDHLRVAMILSEDNGLAQFLPVVDFQPILHENVEHFPDGILIKHPLV